MLYIRLLKLAIQNLTHNKGKSLLTMLGIIIGVTSVVMIISLGAGAESLVINQIQGAGTNLIGVIPGGQDEDEQCPPAAVQGIVITTLKYEDAVAISDSVNVPNVTAATPFVRGNVIATYRDDSENALITGVSHEYLQVVDAEVEEGRFFDKDEEESLSRVAVIGQTIRDDFFEPGEEVLGKRMRLKDTNFLIIGVLEKRGTQGFENQDEQILIPAPTAQKILLGIDHVGLIRAKVDDSANMETATEDITELLRERHDLDPDESSDFTIASQMDALDTLGGITGALSFFLASVAAISLIVGGIGIMNIMLVTVTERTREIGLRKSIGAKNHSIVAQFLIESALLALIGGMIGLVLGTSFSYVVSLVAIHMGYEWDFVISLDSIILALGVSMGTGVLFGWYPAKKASELNPIEALRYE